MKLIVYVGLLRLVSVLLICASGCRDARSARIQNARIVAESFEGTRNPFAKLLYTNALPMLKTLRLSDLKDISTVCAALQIITPDKMGIVVAWVSDVRDVQVRLEYPDGKIIQVELDSESRRENDYS